MNSLQQVPFHGRWVVPWGKLALRRRIPHPQELLYADCRIGMHHCALSGDVAANSRQHLTDLFSRELISKHGHKLQAGSSKNGSLGQWFRGQLRRHQGCEKVKHIDVLVSHSDTFSVSLLPHCHGYAQENASILEALRFSGTSRSSLGHQRFHIADQDFGHLRFIEPAHGLDQVHGTSSPGLLVSCFHVPPHILQRIVFKKLDI
mmetsp:Transcript_120530/g.286345  ORF Transcript_120530/g.286345 Transcript_120530/m.286345 type:complete len:204 (-) Transcript_120530:332-943(-)